MMLKYMAIIMLCASNSFAFFGMGWGMSEPVADTGFPSGWGYKVAITITNTLIDADLTDWTMVFDQSFDSVLTSTNGPLDADGTRPSLNGGGDIRFSSDSAGNTRLACDIRTWVTSNAPASGTAEAAVLIPSVSSTGQTTIYMWWGKSGETQPGVSETYGQYAAYDDDYKGIWDMSGSACTDRLGDNDLSNTSVTTGVAGKVGKAFSYNGTSSQSVKGAPLGLSFANYTYTFVCKPTNTPDQGATEQIVKKEAGIGGGANYVFSYDHVSAAFKKSHAHKAGSGLWTPAQISSSTIGGNWYFLGGCYDGTNIKAIYNGTFEDSTVADGPGILNPSKLSVGSGYGVSYYNGVIDELRISGGCRSDAWIKADYNNQFDTSGFLTWGSISDL